MIKFNPLVIIDKVKWKGKKTPPPQKKKKKKKTSHTQNIVMNFLAIIVSTWR